MLVHLADSDVKVTQGAPPRGWISDLNEPRFIAARPFRSMTLIPSFYNEPPSIPLFRSWLNDRGITVHEHLQLVQDSTGCKVVAQQAIPRNRVLCTVPKDRLLSHKTSQFSTICAVREESTAAEYTLHLASCLLYELRLSTESTHHGWLQLLPREIILLPTFWGNQDISGADGQDALKWIKGTEVEKELRRKDEEGLSMSEIRSYFDAVSHLFPSSPTSNRPPLLNEYLYAYSMISTRGYIIDAYHIMALVPFVDMFNHSNANHTSLLSDSDCCPTCGSLPLCAHDDPDIPTEENRISHLSSQYLAKVVEEGQNVDMRVEMDIEAGKEVFSCYEESLSAGKCMVEWGFFDPTASEVDLRWTARHVLQPEFGEVYMALLGRGRVRTELESTSNVDGWIDVPDNPGCFRVSPTGSISLNLVVALYLRTLEEDPENIEALEDALIRDVNSAFGNGETTGGFGRLGGEIVDLVETRLSTMYQPELSISDLRAEIQKSDRWLLSGMAVRLSLEERKLCEIVKTKWRP